MKISDRIRYVGVDDRRTVLFEGLWPLPMGVSYNSYLVVGQKVALIDTVEADFSAELLSNIRAEIGDRRVDYIVVNHMEPDHSSGITALREAYPEVEIVGNAKTVQMLNGYYGIEGCCSAVVDGATLDLGGATLSFHLTPMVHWPETMMTLLAEEQTLFSGDAFGTFGALGGKVLDAETDTAPYWDEMYRYYSNIVGKYGIPVQKAMQKLSSTEVKTICPTHGPVWRGELQKVLRIYDSLSRYEGERGVVIAYGSMYGNNRAAAEYLAARLADGGMKPVKLYDLTLADPSFVIADAFRYNTLITGSPTYNGEIFPPVENLLRALSSRGLRDRRFGCFGSFTWAGAAVKKMREAAESAGWTILEPSPEFKQGFNQNPKEQFDALAAKICE